MVAAGSDASSFFGSGDSVAGGAGAALLLLADPAAAGGGGGGVFGELDTEGVLLATCVLELSSPQPTYAVGTTATINNVHGLRHARFDMDGPRKESRRCHGERDVGKLGNDLILAVKPARSKR